MGVRDELLAVVIEAGKKLRRTKDEVEPYVKTLMDNWFDSVASLLEIKPEELVSLGMPLRFAKELIAAANDSVPKKDKKRLAPVTKAPPPKKSSRSETKGSASSGDSRKVVPIRRCDAGFRIRAKVLGSGGCNIKHIEKESGCKLRVHEESGSDISVEIISSNEATIEAAERLLKELLESVYQQYESWKTDQRDEGKLNAREPVERPEKKQKNERKKDEHSKIIEIFDADERFNVRGKLIGHRGQNVHHIQDETGAAVDVQGAQDRGEKVRIVITAKSAKDLRHASDICEELIGSTWDEYNQWLHENGRGKASGKGKGKKDKKGGGKSFDIDQMMEKIESLDHLSGAEASEATSEITFRLNGDWFRQWAGKLGIESTEVQQLQEAIQSRLVAFPTSPPHRQQAIKHLKRVGIELADDVSGSDQDQAGDELKYTVAIDVPYTDPEFRAKAKLIGKKGVHLFHIQDDTGTRVDLEGDGDEGEAMKVWIKASSKEMLDKAAAQTQDLVDTVTNAYAEWNRHHRGKEKSGKQNHRGTSASSDDHLLVTDTVDVPVEASDPLIQPWKGALIGLKGRNLHHIQDQTGAKVRLQGDPKAGQTLYFDIRAETQDQIDSAKGEIVDLMKSVRNKLHADTMPSSEGNAEVEVEAAVEGREARKNRKDDHLLLKDTVDVDLTSFDKKIRSPKGALIGIKGQNLQHIKNTTGAKVTVQGDPAAGETLYFEITAATQDQLDSAKGEIHDLINAVKNKSHSKGNNSRGNSRDFIEEIKVFKCSPYFDLRSKLAGDGEANLNHIQEQTNSQIEMVGEGDASSPMHLRITSKSADGLDEAVEMTRDLIHSVERLYKKVRRAKEEEPVDRPPTKRSRTGD